jgi:hypothetical protein
MRCEKLSSVRHAPAILFLWTPLALSKFVAKRVMICITAVELVQRILARHKEEQVDA